MSMPRYTCIESTLTISTSGAKARAISSAMADFPDAVGPTIASGRRGPSDCGNRYAGLVTWTGSDLDETAVEEVRRGRGDLDVGERPGRYAIAREVHELVLTRPP